MFQLQDARGGRRVRLFAAGLAILSLLALSITAWILLDVRHEQAIVERIIEHIPASDLAVAQELSGDLRLQSSLSALLVLNLIGTAIASALVMQRYATSERSLRDVKVLATDILASMDAAVITTDRAGKITSINPRGVDLIEGSRAAIGKPLSEIGSEHQTLWELCQVVLSDHHAIRDRDYTIDASEHRTTLRTSCTLLRNERNDQIGTVIQVRDVSERVLIEERLRRMERYMGLGSLASGLHHEIKNPLSALLLHVQLLAEQLATHPPDAQADELLDVVLTEVKRINDVLDGFRNYASITELGLGPVDVVGIIEKLLRLLRPQADQQGVILKLELPRELLPNILGDSVRLEQVFLNLALNGLAAMQGSGELTIRVAALDEMVQINVSDTGAGIPPEIQSQIFDPYFTTKSDGTGMGLALCDKIIRQHDGTIEFTSTSAGTEFSVSLPIASTADSTFGTNE